MTETELKTKLTEVVREYLDSHNISINQDGRSFHLIKNKTVYNGEHLAIVIDTFVCISASLLINVQPMGKREE
jgi:hypothetical protein